ncbi:hypothetical protein [Mesorhizobium sp. IMUNJ 23232]|uniref:hypothetical protein n=1 Tax=Mesorhizobium sp. IMUNJ 23232 TaxID=3376064 RepID=UPI0037A0F1DD
MTNYIFTRQFPPQVISNFQAGDKLDFSAFNLSSFSQLLPFITHSGADTILTLKFNGFVESLTVKNHTLAASDFLLNTSPADLTVTGTDKVDFLFGGNGDDWFYPGGGAHTIAPGKGDWMLGGKGDDIYSVRESADMIIENADEGFDQVAVSTGGYHLPGGQEIEVLKTTSATGTSQIALTGNEFAQTIIGNAGKNWITGGGDADAADVLRGLGGDDRYTIHNAATIVVEAEGGGFDTIEYYGLADFTLSSGSHVEMVSLSSRALNLTGNELGQTLFGNAYDNILNGAGGADTMAGRGGDDIYYVDNIHDNIQDEGIRDGVDRVATTVSWQLLGGAIEFLNTTSLNGTKDINLSGNNYAQKIVGNAGDNRLDGKGGLDTLVGYKGDDTFVLSWTGPYHSPTIADFTSGEDLIELRSLSFSLPSGALGAGVFRANTTGLAEGASDRIIYDTDDGMLYYDPDGSGAYSKVLIAKFVGLPALASSDFVVV